MNKTYSPLSKQFGSRLRELREAKEMSQERLALETGLDRTYISGIERGLRNPSLKNIGKLASGLNASINDLFSS